MISNYLLNTYKIHWVWTFLARCGVTSISTGFISVPRNIISRPWPDPMSVGVMFSQRKPQKRSWRLVQTLSSPCLLYPCLPRTDRGRVAYTLSCCNFCSCRCYAKESYQTSLKPNPNTMLSYGTLILIHFLPCTVCKLLNNLQNRLRWWIHQSTSETIYAWAIISCGW